MHWNRFVFFFTQKIYGWNIQYYYYVVVYLIFIYKNENFAHIEMRIISHYNNSTMTKIFYKTRSHTYRNTEYMSLEFYRFYRNTRSMIVVVVIIIYFALFYSFSFASFLRVISSITVIRAICSMQSISSRKSIQLVIQLLYKCKTRF